MQYNIIDEIQLVPELVSHLQEVIDQENESGAIGNKIPGLCRKRRNMASRYPGPQLEILSVG